MISYGLSYKVHQISAEMEVDAQDTHCVCLLEGSSDFWGDYEIRHGSNYVGTGCT